MRLLTLLPITRTIRTDTLSYFGSDEIPLGTIVSIPLRKKTIHGIVIESQSALEAKSEIKNMNFVIKKITRHKEDKKLPEWLMQGARLIAEQEMISIGSALAGLLPQHIIEDTSSYFDSTDTELGKAYEHLAVQNEDNERSDIYRSIIRESFAKKKSIAIILPTKDEALKWQHILSKGIADYTYLVDDTKTKTFKKDWSRIIHDEHPFLFIGTGDLLSLLPLRVTTIILENESSRFYKKDKTPFLDVRRVAKEIAKARKSKLIFGDTLLSVETHVHIQESSIVEYSRLSKRLSHKIQTLIVDMSPKTDEDRKGFRILSPELAEMVRFNIKQNKKLFIFATRRGLATHTTCRDCGKTVFCDECESPVVLHTKKSARVFVCHHCGKERNAEETCTHCGSWNLVSYGIGIETIEQELKKIVDAPIIKIEGDSTKTQKQIKDALRTFDKGGILLGTDLALRFLENKSVDFSAIISLESILALPDFRTNERLMHTILDVKLKANDCILIQARDPKNTIIEFALQGDLDGFIKEELDARKRFGYPPFTRIVKITIKDNKEKIRLLADEILHRLKDWKPRVFPAFIKTIKNQSLLHIMIKIERQKWKDNTLRQILLSLPPQVKIDTSPQSLL